MRVLHVASEIYPLVKTGGLGDVMGALPAAQARIGVETRVLIPGYPAVLDAIREQRRILTDPDLFHGGPAQLLLAQVEGIDVPAYVLDCGSLFHRPGNPYIGPDGHDWGDNLARFAALSWAGAAIGRGGDPSFTPDIVNAHDWQSALVPVFSARDGGGARTVMTIHNLGYQGRFPLDGAGILGVPGSWVGPMGPLEYEGGLSLLKGGIGFADCVTTVSPTYASETRTPTYGQGLDGVLRERGSAYGGILNGIDAELWNPSSDPNLPQAYGVDDRATGKAAAKAALQTAFGLPTDPDVPLLVVVSRLAWAKGLDLLLHCVPDIVASGAQLAVLGSGDPGLEDGFRQASNHHPTRIACRIGFDEGLAHLMQAGGDLIVIPSREEPCGLTQLYGLRYGTLPLARRTGGLADTIVNADSDAVAAGTATGFLFDFATVEALAGTIRWAVDVWRSAEIRAAMQQTGMLKDSSWPSAAEAYVDLYQQIMTPPA